VIFTETNRVVKLRPSNDNTRGAWEPNAKPREHGGWVV